MSSPPAVSLRGVTVRFGDRCALREVDLDVRPGERVALVGPSGAGKTTLLSVVNGTVRPDSGTAVVLGVDPARADRRTRSRVGTVHQGLYLAGPLQAIHNVNAGRLARWSLARAVRSLARPVDVGLATAVLARVGIGDKVHQRTDRLSGGEQQRVAIARMLVQDPDVMLADEPISALDPARGREVVDLLCALAEEDSRSLLMSLHAFDVAVATCDRVVGMRAGRVLFDLPAPQVDPAAGAALYDLDPT